MSTHILCVSVQPEYCASHGASPLRPLQFGWVESKAPGKSCPLSATSTLATLCPQHIVLTADRAGHFCRQSYHPIRSFRLFNGQSKSFKCKRACFKRMFWCVEAQTVNWGTYHRAYMPLCHYMLTVCVYKTAGCRNSYFAQSKTQTS